MAELDVEALEGRLALAQSRAPRHVEGVVVSINELIAIIAALEDRDRAAVERFVAVEKDCCGCAEAKKLRAVLEGRDG